MSWKIKSVKEIFSSKIFKFRSEECINEEGKIVPNYYIFSPGDWVQIIPFVSQNELLVVEQYRHGRGKVYTEFPGGVVDPGEEPLAAAQRELLEECGYASDDVVYLGSQDPNPAFLDNQLHVFYARNCKKVSEQNLDEFEVIQVKTVSLNELDKIVSKKGHHSLFLSTYFTFKNFLDKEV